MSSFIPLNLSEDSAALDAEEHTRELQVEEAFKIFQKALKYQKDREYIKAHHEYEELFKVEVVSKDGNAITPTIETLRYLSYRNRGVLGFQELEDYSEHLTNELLTEKLFSSVEDMVTALYYSEGDSNLMDILYEIFEYFDNKRLSRFTLEYELSKEEEDEEVLSIRSRYLSPHTAKLLGREKGLLLNLHDSVSLEMNEALFKKINKSINHSKDHENISTKLQFLKNVKDDFMKAKCQNSTPDQLKVVLDEFSCLSLVKSMVEKLALDNPKNKISENASTSSFERIIFEFPETDDRSDICEIDDIEIMKPGIFKESTTIDLESVDKEGDAHLIEKTQLEIEEDSSKNDDQQQKDDALENSKQQQRLSRLRKKSDDRTELSRVDFSENVRFFDNFNHFLKLCDTGITDVISPFLGENVTFEDMHIHDFRKSLTNWNPKTSELLISSSDNKSDIPLIDIFNSTIFNETEEYVKSVDEVEGFQSLSEFLSTINSQSKHISLVSIDIIELLLGDRNGTCLITNTQWSPELIELIQNFTTTYDNRIHDQIRQSISQSATSEQSHLFNISLCLSFYEILVDNLINLKNKIALNPRRTDTRKEEENIEERIQSWSSLIDDLLFISSEEDISKLFLRYKWTNVFYSQQILHKGNSEISAMLREVHEDLDVLEQAINIPFANYKYIPRLSLSSINIQLSKISVLATFANILNKDDDRGESAESINLLELILISEEDIETLGFEPSIQKFIDNSSIDLILRLWNILLNYYRKNKEYVRFQHGTEKVLSFLLEQITTKSYTKQSESNRQNLLMKVIGFYGIYIDGFLKMFSQKNWKLKWDDMSLGTLNNLLHLMRLLYMFCLSEDSAAFFNTSDSLKVGFAKSYKVLKDRFVNTVAMIFLYYRLNLPTASKIPYNINDMLSVIHEQLGIRQFCDGGDGMFLKMAQEILLELTWEDSDKDISQVISCRYHYNISMDNFTPFEHYTEKIQLDKYSVFEIAGFVLPICFKKKNPFFNIPKSDLKSLLDGIYEVIGDPPEDNNMVMKNSAVLDNLLESTSLNPKYIRQAFYGLIDIDLPRPRTDTQVIADGGLYYLQGLMALSLYKARKKTLQGRSVELGTVIKMLRLDLICGSERLESWLLLGQAYGYLVEDDLIWTSDKLNGGDRKNSTAILQKTSIICYLMAISVLLKSDHETRKRMKPIAAILMSCFSKEMYNACMAPMSMLCFKVHVLPKFVKKSQGASFEKLHDSSIKVSTIQKVILHSLNLAIQANPEDWSNYYYMSKVQHKLKEDPYKVIDSLLNACDFAKKVSNISDPIVEPHYRLCSLIMKYVKREELSIEDAVQFLNRDPIVQPDASDSDGLDKKQFMELIVSCLKRIISYDKRKWHHKPRYRLAKIYFEEFDNSEKAKEEMLNLVTIKSTNKGLVQIWKPENERPGKHFIYTFDYVTFFTTIVAQQLDLESLLQIIPKLRRAGSGMISLYKAWEYTCSSICMMIRKLANIGEAYTDQQIALLNYSSFLANASQLVNFLKGGIPQELENKLCMLSEVNEIKRLNNGFGPTSFIDDTYIALYLKIYLCYQDKYEEVTIPDSIEQPQSTPKTKVAKRDFFPCGGELLRVLRKDIDTIIKDKPKVFQKQDQIDTIEILDDTESIKSNSQVTTVKVDQSKKSTDINPGKTDENKEPYIIELPDDDLYIIEPSTDMVSFSDDPPHIIESLTTEDEGSIQSFEYPNPVSGVAPDDTIQELADDNGFYVSDASQSGPVSELDILKKEDEIEVSDKRQTEIQLSPVENRQIEIANSPDDAMLIDEISSPERDEVKEDTESPDKDEIEDSISSAKEDNVIEPTKISKNHPEEDIQSENDKKYDKESPEKIEVIVDDESDNDEVDEVSITKSRVIPKELNTRKSSSKGNTSNRIKVTRKTRSSSARDSVSLKTTPEEQAAIRMTIDSEDELNNNGKGRIKKRKSSSISDITRKKRRAEEDSANGHIDIISDITGEANRVALGKGGDEKQNTEKNNRGTIIAIDSDMESGFHSSEDETDNEPIMYF